ncbi:MAG: hypothetical protein ACYTEQ_11930 [Planctomycetota bacterium]|jgi:hypothetical protein
MVISAKKTTIIVSIIIGVLAIATICVLWREHSHMWWHAFPEYNEVYEWRDPDKGETVIRAVVMTWTDDTRELSVLMFRGIDGSVWYIDIAPLSLDDPNSWLVFRGSTAMKSKVPLSKMKYLPVGTANVEDWSSINQSDGRSAKK